MFVIQPRTLTLGEENALLKVTLDIGREQLVAPQTQLRLIIYDFDLYDRDQTTKADQAIDAGQSLDDFEIDSRFFTGAETSPGGPFRRLVLPEPFLNPKVEPGTGVLAVADLNFRRVESKAEREAAARSGAGQWYVNEVIGHVRTASDSPFLIGLSMFAKRGDDGTFGTGTLRRQVIGRFGISIKDLEQLESPRVLALRLISPHAQGPLKRGTIVLSSFNVLDNAVGKTRGLRARGVQLNIKKAQQSLSKPGAPSREDVGAEPIPSRRAKLDLTGRYELQVTGKGVDPKSPDYVAPASLWISQAGQALVAWYLPYREIGFDAKFTGEADKLIPVSRRACLMTTQSDNFPNRAFTFWCLDTGAERIDPDRLMVSTEFSDEKNDVPVLIGDIEVLEASQKATVVEVVFNRKWKLSNDPDKSQTSAEENATVGVFKRVAGGSRMPWICVKQLGTVSGVGPSDVDAVVRSHVEPLPMGWWVVLGKKLASSDMQDAVRRFSKFRDTREVARQEFERVGRLINELVGAFPSRQYRNEALSWVQSHSRQIKLKGFAGEEKTLLEWLADIASTHLALEIERAEKTKGSALTEEEKAAVRAKLLASQGGVLGDLGLLGGDEFEYEFTFNVITEMALTVLLGGLVGAVMCTVKRRSRDPLKQKDDYERTFVGAFLGVSSGVGGRFSFFKKESAGGSGAPPSCKIRTFFEIRERDWVEPPLGLPMFKVAAVCTGLSLGGTIVELQTALNMSSTLFMITAPGAPPRPSVTLSAIVENAGKWEFSPSDISQIIEKVEQGDIFSAQAVLFAISESVGLLIPVEAAKGRPPPSDEFPIIADQENPLSQTVNAPLVAFETGSSIIRADQLLDFDRRLAMYRYLFELPGWYYCAGFTSPEFRARKQDASAANKILSQNRAIATDDYVTASLGKPGQGVISKVKVRREPIGAGREPSLRPRTANPPGGGLHDPYDPKTPEDVRQLEEQTEYHKWRRVDLVVNATLVARVWGQ